MASVSGIGSAGWNEGEEPVARRVFDHVLILMFENQYRGYVRANPFLRQLAAQGIELDSCFGVMHPSQTNYIASIAGALCNVTTDERPALIDERTVVDLIEEAPGRLRWKGYMDSYIPQSTPWTPELAPQDAHPYYVKHNPFSSFSRIVRSEERWRCIDSEAAFFSDLLNGELPEYVWFTPNIWNDGHWIDGTMEDTKPRAPALVDQLACWLEGFFARLRFPGPDSHLPPRTLVVVTFDEADFELEYDPEMTTVYDGPNQIYTVLLGDCVEPGLEEEGYNHYSLLRTIEKNFSLGDLGKNDAEANWFQFLWGRRYRWSGALETPIGGADHGRAALCAAGFGGGLFVGYPAADSTMRVRIRAADPAGGVAGQWSDEEALPIDGAGGAALGVCGNELVLVARSAAGDLQYLTYDFQAGWAKAPQPLASGPGAGFALAAFDRGQKLMLAVSDPAGNVSSFVRAGGAWAAPVPVPAAQMSPGGGIALGTVGSSLFLIVQAPDGSMNVVSYNSAPFNVVTVPKFKYGGPQDNSAIDVWSPSAFPVAHFSSRPDAVGEQQPEAQPYRTSGPLAVATLDGVMHLVHPGPGNPLLMSETFSLAGVLTPMQPVSYKSSDAPDFTNGFGTLAEAGWSRQVPFFDARCEAGGELALARAGAELVLLCRPRPGAAVELRVGRYKESD